MNATAALGSLFFAEGHVTESVIVRFAVAHRGAPYRTPDPITEIDPEEQKMIRAHIRHCGHCHDLFVMLSTQADLKPGHRDSECERLLGLYAPNIPPIGR